jgi:hypothetical protein
LISLFDGVDLLVAGFILIGVGEALVWGRGVEAEGVRGVGFGVTITILGTGSFRGCGLGVGVLARVLTDDDASLCGIVFDGPGGLGRNGDEERLVEVDGEGDNGPSDFLCAGDDFTGVGTVFGV